jgi:hypothetical protein
MPSTFKFTLKFFIGWFLLVSALFVAHFLARPELWPAISRLLWGFGVTAFLCATSFGFLATCAWVVSRFRLFDDEYWY